MTRSILPDAKTAPALLLRLHRPTAETWELRLGDETIEVAAGERRLAALARSEVPERLRLTSAATGTVTLVLPGEAGGPCDPRHGRLSPEHLKRLLTWLGPAAEHYMPRAWRRLAWLALVVGVLAMGIVGVRRLAGSAAVTDFDALIAVAGALIFATALLVLRRPLPWFALLELVPLGSFLVIDLIWMVRSQLLGWWVAVAVQGGLLVYLGWRFRKAYRVYLGIRCGIASPSAQK